MLQSAAKYKIFTIVRVGWIALIVFLVPILARGDDCAPEASTFNADMASIMKEFETCGKTKPSENDDNAKKLAQEINSKREEAQKVLQSLIEETTSITSDEQSAALVACKSTADPKDFSFSQAEQMETACDAYKKASQSTGGISGKAAGAAGKANGLKYHDQDPAKSCYDTQKGRLAAALNQKASQVRATTAMTVNGSLMCAQNKSNLPSLKKSAAESKDDIQKYTAIAQMATSLGQMGQNMMKTMSEMGATTTSSTTSTLTDPNSSLDGLGGLGSSIDGGAGGNGGGPGGPNGDGTGGPKPLEIGIAKVGNGVGLAVDGGSATSTSPEGSAGNPSGTSPLSPYSTSSLGGIDSVAPGKFGNLGGVSGVAGSGGGGGSGDSRAPASTGKGDTTGASADPNGTAAAEGDKTSPSTGGGGGSHPSFLGMGSSDSGGFGDLMSGMKNPLDAQAEAPAGSNVLQFSSGAPAGDPRLAGAPELDKSSIDPDSVFSVVSACILRQREQGNTR